jgi:protein SCO1/2
MPAFDGATPPADVVAHVDRVRAAPALRDCLVDLLTEQAPLYAGRGTAETERLRGYVLASFETTGLPATAVAYVLEELESGINPYTVAAAARAMRGAESVPERAVPLLLKALNRIRLSDDFVSFEGCCATAGDRASATALMEILRTIAWVGPRAQAAVAALRSLLALGGGGFSAAVHAEIEKTIAAVSGGKALSDHSCCSGAASRVPSGAAIGSGPSSANIARLELEDQDGAVLTFGEFLLGRPSVVTFFYTRCMNPEKCSLTVTKLARLQRRICDEGLPGRVNIAAFTYDPAFDLPRRLRAYGSDRGMAFDAHNRMLRTTGPFEPLQRHFDLGVGYGPATVNRHRTDLFILDAKGDPTFDIARRLWDETEVLDALKAGL